MSTQKWPIINLQNSVNGGVLIYEALTLDKSHVTLAHCCIVNCGHRIRQHRYNSKVCIGTASEGVIGEFPRSP